MENIRINSSIKKFGIENEDGELVAVLELDASNTNIVDKYGRLYEKLQKISEDLQNELERVQNETGDTLTPADITELTGIYGKHINAIIDELEQILGEGFIHDVFAKNYELDSNFIPDADLLSELLKSLFPIMERVYKKKNVTYSPTKKGKRTREDKIAEYKKMSANED